MATQILLNPIGSGGDPSRATPDATYHGVVPSVLLPVTATSSKVADVVEAPGSATINRDIGDIVVGE